VKLQRIDSVTGWARYRVSVDGQLVGAVAEEREWLGHRYGPRRWCATHNPTGVASSLPGVVEVVITPARPDVGWSAALGIETYATA
jgi:hypothetical protein